MTQSKNNNRRTVLIQRFVEISKSFFVDAGFERLLRKLGLISMDAVFSFNAGRNLAKENLAGFRSRLRLETDWPETTLFLKLYDRPPVLVQLKNWLQHRARASLALLEFETASELASAGINTPKVVCYGEQWGTFFEKRSFIITERIPDGEALERKLPDCFTGEPTTKNLEQQRDFIAKLAFFVKRFHETRYRHRDLYLSHIFYTDKGSFHLIDLARAFKPILFHKRFQIKDIAQLYYSAPADYFSGVDRLRFYLAYAGQSKLTEKDKAFIRRVLDKARRMARHDAKHNRSVPFMPG
jgi:hypothetical protein